MQGVPYHLLLDGYPPFLSQETDTATPQTPVPIYYIHTLTKPFCRNALCACQRRENSKIGLLRGLIEGIFLLLEAAALTKTAKVGISEAQSIPPTTTVREAAPLVTMPVLCHFYGHSWQGTENPYVKECELCHIRGYCPGCTPQAPNNAQPFFCTSHTRICEVQ